MLATFASLTLERPTYSLEVSSQKGYVNDLAGLLPRDYAVDLDARLQRFEQQADHKISILTVTSLEGNDIKSFSRRFFPDWQLDGPSKSIVLVIIKNEGKVLIESSPALAQVLNDPTMIRSMEGAVLSFLDGYKPEVGVERGLESLVERLNTGQSLQPPARETTFWNVGGQAFSIIALVLPTILAFAFGLLLGVSSPVGRLPLYVRWVLSGGLGSVVALGVGAIVSAFDQLSSGLWIFIAVSGFVFGALGSIKEFWSSGSITEKKKDERLKTPFIGGL